MPTALITGITGQDGSYLAELLLSKNYKVVGMVSRDFAIGDQNIAHLESQIELVPGDLLDQASIKSLIETYRPDEIYNLGGITYIPASWEKPALTFDINTLGVARILEVLLNLGKTTKFYQAGSSKMFGTAKDNPQTEATPFSPEDPYSVSKAASHYLVRNFRQHHGLFACNGIMFNHESPRRGPEFVTRKITQAAAKISKGLAQSVELGDLEARQDWGFAPDYVEAMWLMLQQNEPDDYVIASGQTHSVRQICEIAFGHVGLDYQDYVKINPEFVRHPQLFVPQGDASKAKSKLSWSPIVDFKDMIVKMVEYDIESLAGQNT